MAVEVGRGAGVEVGRGKGVAVGCGEGVGRGVDVGVGVGGCSASVTQAVASKNRLMIAAMRANRMHISYNGNECLCENWAGEVLPIGMPVKPAEIFLTKIVHS